LGHQIGGFLGVWLGGRLYDSVGSYNIVWYLAIAFGVFAFFVHLPITDKPIDQHRLALE
jgi:predicted MFS family arabinose efflux permease